MGRPKGSKNKAVKKKAAPRPGVKRGRPPKKQETRGRKSKYDPAFVKMAYIICRSGPFTDERLGEVFGGVTAETIRNWKNEHKDFRAAIQQGKDEFDSLEVEASLWKLIKGYTYDEIHIEKDGNVVISTKVVRKQVPPSITGIIFWLKNRNPDRWRDLKAVEWAPAGDKAFMSKGRITEDMSLKEAMAAYEEMCKQCH